MAEIRENTLFIIRIVRLSVSSATFAYEKEALLAAEIALQIMDADESSHDLFKMSNDGELILTVLSQFITQNGLKFQVRAIVGEDFAKSVLQVSRLRPFGLGRPLLVDIGAGRADDQMNGTGLIECFRFVLVDFPVGGEMFSISKMIVLHRRRSLVAVHVSPHAEIDAVLNHQRFELFLQMSRIRRLIGRIHRSMSDENQPRPFFLLPFVRECFQGRFEKFPLRRAGRIIVFGGDENPLDQIRFQTEEKVAVDFQRRRIRFRGHEEARLVTGVIEILLVIPGRCHVRNLTGDRGDLIHEEIPDGLDFHLSTCSPRRRCLQRERRNPLAHSSHD